jgi:hypothetical protein
MPSGNLNGIQDKIKDNPFTCNRKHIEVVRRSYTHSSVLDKGDQHHSPSILSFGSSPGIDYGGDWVGPIAVCTGMEKKKLLAHSGDLTPNRPGCSKWYTEYAIPGP